MSEINSITSRRGRFDTSQFKNLSALNIAAETACPCVSLLSDEVLLRAKYGSGATSVDQQAALLIALSRYDTGSPLKDLINGCALTHRLKAIISNIKLAQYLYRMRDLAHTQGFQS